MPQTAPTVSVSERLADWAGGLDPAALPAATAAKARDILVDITGLCFAARHTDYVAAVRAACDPGPATIIGQGATATPGTAALVNGTAAHGEDFDDTFEGGPIHSGAVAVPALLAAAEQWDLPNDRVMLGIAVAAETMCRLATAVPKAVHKAGFHPTAVLGAFGATLGVAVATGATRRQTVDALGIVGSMASGIIEYLGDGSWTKRMHPGWSAQSALKAVAMARAGFVGPRMVFEGTHGAFSAFAPSISPQIDVMFDGLGRDWVTDTITFKPYPCGTMVQPYIDVAIKLKRQGAPLEGITRITCKTAEGIVHRLWEPLELKQTPPTDYAAKFSTPFGVALGLVRGQAGLSDFTPETIADPQLLDICRKTGFEIDPDNPYPKAFTGHVRIDYADGSVRELAQGHMRGGIVEPLSRDEIDGKFAANLAFGGENDAGRVLELCNRIGAGEGGRALIRGLAAG